MVSSLMSNENAMSNLNIIVVCVCVCALSHVRLFANPRIEVHQARLSVGFPRQEYWTGLPFPTAGDLPETGVKSLSLIISCIDRQILYHNA